MLVLSRRVDEKIVIADGTIEIMVVSVMDDKVRLGVVAPRETSIHRQEVWAAIQREKRAKSEPTV